jgi:tRNA-dependent cyclodipeptide synthase
MIVLTWSRQASKKMRIANYLNVTEKEIQNKQHNIWIGISLGNKYFTKENIREYILWAIDNTKDEVLVVIADALHAINLEVLDHRSPDRAFKKAVRIGDEKNKEIQEIIDTLPENKKNKVRVVRWKDILNHESYKRNLELIKNEYKTNPDFRALILEITKSGRSDRAERISKMNNTELDRLVDYVLHELPPFVDGVQGYDQDLIYTVIPYPGLNKLNELAVGLSNKTLFLDLAQKLNLTHSIGIIEAYVV